MSFSVFNCVSSNATGGLEQMYLNYASVISGDDKVLCIVSEKFKYFKELETRGIPYEVIKVRNYYDLIAAYQFIKLYKKYRPKCVISHNGRFNSVLKMCTRFTKIENTIGVCHGDVKRLEHFSKVITVSMALRQQLLAKNLKNVFFLPNFIETNGIKKRAQKNHSKTYTFGMMSRLAPEKSISVGIKSFQRLTSQSNDKYHLIIAGTGPEHDMLVDLVKQHDLQDSVTFLDWVEDKYSFYNQLDCFIIPSKHEPFGLTILEAFSYNVPVISAKAEGPREIIEDEINGLLFDINDTDQLLYLMTMISRDKTLSNQIADEGYMTLKNKFTQKTFKKNLYAVLEHA